MVINDLMTKHVISICEDESVEAAAKLMMQYNIGSLPVHNSKGKLRGIVTDRDIVLRYVASEHENESVNIGDIMTRNIVMATPFDKPEEVAEKMGDKQIRRVPIADNGKLVGMMSLADVARNQAYKMETANALSEISSNYRRKK